MEITIKSNGHSRNFIGWDDLPESARRDFDYLETDDEKYAADFFKYRGVYYCTDQFMRVSSQFAEPWEGYHADSYFSGVLIAYDYDHGGLFVGRYYC